MYAGPLRLLLLQSNPTDVRLMREAFAALDPAVEITHAERFDQAEPRLRQAGCVNAILLDLGLPDYAGLSAMTRARAVAPSVPILVLAHREDEALAMEAVCQGAQDYWVRGQSSPNVLLQKIHHAIKRQRREQELHRLNRILKAFRDTNQAMVRAMEEAEYLKEACRIIVEDCGHALVWIGYAENDEGKRIRPVTYSGFDEGYLSTLNLTWADAERGRGPTGTAIRTGKPCLCRNMRADPAFTPWREEAVRRGFASSLSLPLRIDGKAIGAITIYAEEPDFFSDDELGLLAELADDLAYGIAAIRLRSAHARTAAMLRHNEARYRSLVELSPDAVFVNRNNRVEFVNPAALALFGADRAEQIIGKSPLQLFHPDDHAGIRERIRTLMDGHVVPLIDEKIVRLDGALRDVAVTAAPFVDSEGAAIQVILHDISDRKCAEERLRHLNDELRRRLAQWETMLDVLPVGVAVTEDPQAEHIKVNPVLAASLGVTVDQNASMSAREGRPGYRCFREGHELAVSELPMQQAVRGIATADVELDVLRADGGRVQLLASAVPLRNEQGQCCGAIAVFLDVTRRRQMEEDLRHAKEAAETANVAKSQFLANVSHELRTPMNAVLGMTELALNEELSPTVQDYLTTAKESAESLLELLNQLLDFSRIEAGKFQLEPIPFSLRNVVDQTVRTLSVRAYEKGLELICDLPEVVSDRVIGDPLRLRQILVNLVGNAIKFTEQGEVIVRVREVKGEDHGDTTSAPSSTVLEFAVIDTGVGISAEEQKGIFTPFTQGDASTTRRFGGTGLGLAISSSLVGLMGGRIWVKSTPGCGSTFFFTVAFGLQPVSIEESEAMVLGREQLRGLPVLVVAHNVTIGHIVEQILFQWAMKPETVRDVPSALAKIHEAASRSQAFPLAIIDAALPGIDGLTLATWIKQAPELVGASVLMLSHIERHNHAQRCRELNAILADKPLSQANLFNAITRAVGGKCAGGSATTKPPAEIQTPPVRPLQVLVVEDIPPNQKLVRAILTRRGHAVELANNGAEAVEWARRKVFDAVLMDVQMPVMDGFQATAAIRALGNDGRPPLPIIAMTAHAMREDAQRCLAAGMDSYLSKPIKADELIALLERLTGNAALDPATPPEDEREQRDEPNAAATADISDLDHVFNLEQALQRCFDRQMFYGMVEFFFEECEALVGRMRAAQQQGDAAEMVGAAHRLRGTVLYLGAAPALTAARQVEERAAAGEFTAAAEAIEQLDIQTRLLKRALAPHREAKSP